MNRIKRVLTYRGITKELNKYKTISSIEPILSPYNEGEEFNLTIRYKYKDIIIGYGYHTQIGEINLFGLNLSDWLYISGKLGNNKKFKKIIKYF